MGFSLKTGKERSCEIAGFLLLCLALGLFLALVTDQNQKTGNLALDEIDGSRNICGIVGAVLTVKLYVLFGHASHVSYFLAAVWGTILMRQHALDRLLGRLFGAFILTVCVAAALDLQIKNPETLSGGVMGAWFGEGVLRPLFGKVGGTIIACALGVVGILLATEFMFLRAAKVSYGIITLTLQAINELYKHFCETWFARRAEKAKSRPKTKAPDIPVSRTSTPPAPVRQQDPEPRDLNIRVSTPEELPFEDVPSLDALDEEPVAATPSSPPEDTAPTPVEEEPVVEEQMELVEPTPEPAERKPKKRRNLLRRKTAVEDELPPDYQYPKRYKKPPLTLLNPPQPIEVGDITESLRQTSNLLEETLQTFNIEARVTDVTRGPTITRFELDPAPGIKVSRFQSLADDIALALKAHRVRVEAPIPGKGRVGIEVPNARREAVVARELLESQAFRKNKGKLNLALGKDVAGEVVVTDLATMPHVLVAGATGAGKTVCVKTLLASLLFAHSPDELQMVLVDPKMVELSIFADIPHLITPVVTDAKKAAGALNWLITEMEERYRLFSHLRVRNIDVYNESVDNGEIEMAGEEDEDVESFDAIRKLPYIVCIIDELADLMMLARAEVEDAIARLAQLARAVGIHLVIATQRPSVDVLTGVIKANFPARVSFQVSSRVDSRCILDQIGAERLIGMGDMLYLPPGQSKAQRIQGAFVSDEEMSALIAYLKTQAPPQYRDEIEKFGQKDGTVQDLDDDTDELLDDAIRVVLETGQASISMVQRRLRVGYTRAARLIDIMELKGIVGPHVGSKAREILVADVSAGNEADHDDF